MTNVESCQKQIGLALTLGDFTGASNLFIVKSNHCILCGIVQLGIDTTMGFGVVLDTLKSYFQMDQQVDINPYLTKAIAPHHSKAYTLLTPSKCTSKPIYLLASWTLNPISLHFILFRFMRVYGGKDSKMGFGVRFPCNQI